MYQSMLVRSGRSAVAFFSALALAGSLLLAPSMALAAANVTPASNGTNVSIDTSSVAGGTPVFKTLNGPTITETASGDIATGTHTISLPLGWEFKTDSTITIGVGGGDIVIQESETGIIPSQTSFSFTVTSASNSPSPVMFFGLKVRPTGTTAPSTGNMTYSGTAGIAGVTGSTNFGTLSTVAGVATQLAFTTPPGATTVYGSNLSTQPVIKTQDQFDNDSTNGASGKTVTLTLAPDTGTLGGTVALDISGGTATFTDLYVDTIGTGKQLTALAEGLDSATSGLFEITAKPLTATVTANDKTYDGDNTAVVTAVDVSAGLVYGDVVTADVGTLATFSDANAGLGKTVTATGITLNGAKETNYSFDGTGTGTANINQLGITVTPTVGQTKVYGSADSVFTYGFTPTLIGTDAFTGTLSRVANENVGTHAYTIGTLADGLDNYSLTLVPGTFEITQKPLTVTATGVDKEYSGTSDATVTLSTSDEVLGDGLELNYTTASFLDETAANGKQVDVSGISIGGAKAGNYNLLNTTEQTTATITKKALTATLNLNNKTYDGDTSAAYSPGTHVELSGVILGDEVTPSDGTSKSFSDKNVGVGKTVTAVGIELSGADAGNYDFDGIGTGTATINVRPITVTAAANNKTYDGTPSSIATPTITVGALQTGDTLNFSQTYDDKNVGTNKTLTPSGSVTDGNEGNNYAVTFVNNTTGVITQAPLTATVTVEKKVIDETTGATIVDVVLNEVIPGDDVTISNDGTAEFADPAVGPHAVTATGVTITGDDAGNYDFSDTATGTGEILPVPTTVYVDDTWTGTDAWTDVDGPATYFGYDAFATIQGAVDAVEEGGTVNVLAGIYTQDLVITKELSLQGADKATTKIKGVETEPNASFPLATPNIDIQADGVTISGFTIESPDVADGEYSSGVVLTGQNITITNNAFVLIQAGTPPVSNDSNTSVAIQTYSKAAVPTSNVSGLTVSGNTFSGTPAKGYYGVYVNPDIGVGAVTINGNTLAGHIWRAITAERSNVTISGNTIANTDTGETWGNSGIRVVDWGTAVIDSVSITGNTITGNGGLGTGILFGYSGAGHTLNNVVVTDNTITGSDSGVVVHVSAEEVSVNENTIQNNTVNLNNTDTAQLDSTNNYWGTAVANTIDSLIGGDVDFDPYYVDEVGGILSNVEPTMVYADDDYEDGLGNDGHYFGYDAFATIQDAIGAVEDGGTVTVAAGTYDEQLQINKDITISGETGATIQPTGDDDAWDIQFVAGGSGATLEEFTLDFNGADDDRPGRGIAVSDLNGPDVTNVTIQSNDITMGVGIGAATGGLEGVGIQTGKDADVSGLQILSNDFHGGSAVITDGATQGEEGIYINPNAGVGSITISDNTFDGELFTGISVEADNVTVSGNTVTRPNIATNTNGIRINDFVTGVAYDVTISGNTVSGFDTGLRLGRTTNGNSTLTVSVTENTITGNTRGIWAREDSVVTASDNSIISNTTGAEILSGSDGSLDAAGNWWGDATGPNHVSNPTGTGDAVSDNVTFRPWYLALDTSLDSIAPTVDLTYSANPAGVGSMTITATYSETIDGTPQISINQPGTTDISNANMTGSGAVWTYAYTVTAADGSAYVDGTATVSLSSVNDPSGNIAGSPTGTTFTIDTVAPTATITGEQIGTTKLTTANITVGGTDVTHYKYKIDTDLDYGAETPVADQIILSGLADGARTVSVIGRDAAGNYQVEATTATWTVDSTPPVAPTVVLLDPINAGNETTVTITGTGETGASIDYTITDSGIGSITGTGTVDGSGNISITGIDVSTLADGTLTVSATLTDDAGNEGDAGTATATKDTSAPSITSKSPDASAVGVDPTGDITVVFDEDVVITADNVTGVTAGVTGTGTNTATINPTSDLTSNTTYTITLTGVTDTAGNALPETSWIFTTAGSYSFTLTNGWNLVALGVVPNNTSISTILGDSSGDVESIWSYDAVTNEWSVYRPDGSGNLSSMTAGNGYWVNYTSSSPVTLSGSGNLFLAGENTPPSRTLKAGWNLLGYYQRESNTTAVVTNALKTLKSQDSTPIPWWSMIVKHDNSAKQFGTVENNGSLTSGQGYWILMGGRATDTYIYAPGVVDP